MLKFCFRDYQDSLPTREPNGGLSQTDVNRFVVRFGGTPDEIIAHNGDYGSWAYAVALAGPLVFGAITGILGFLGGAAEEASTNVSYDNVPEAANKGTADTQSLFGQKLNDIEETPENWKKTAGSTIPSTKKGNQGGYSTKEEYTHETTGSTIYKHILTDNNGK